MQLNYLWPQYSLPWNNFIGRVQPNPYYLANQLRNITIRAIESPLIFDSHVVVASASIWQNIMSTDSSVVASSASKVFVGKYVDMVHNIAGLQFEYRFSGTSALTMDMNATLFIAVDLAKSSPELVNIPSSALIGRVGVAPQASPCAGTSYCLNTAVAVAPGAPLPASGSYYILNSNRLYIAVSRAAAGTAPESVSYDFTLRVVETTTPLHMALDPFLDPLPPIV
jgi:hypothetical protein